MSLEESGYSELALAKLTEANTKVGDTITVHQGDETFVGILMPRSQVGSDPYHVVIKLESGYNIGIRLDSLCKIERTKGSKRRKTKEEKPEKPVPNLPNVSILSTGGTIASKVDYRTGAVNPALTARDLYETVPELQQYANVEAKIVLSALSEDITPTDWTKIVKTTAKQIRGGADGIVIAHGTDTMGYTAAALSFALQNLPVPVVLVGSQRSSDRPSSDAAMNLINATCLAGKADAAEVMVSMHGTTNDSYTYAHRGVRARKFHTSRRDAFQSVNDYPLFKVAGEEIEEIHPPLRRRDSTRKIKVKPRFDEKVALVKTYPGVSGSIIDDIVAADYHGLVIEGTGLGHTPTAIQPSIRKAIDAGLLVAMTSQCVFGRVDMNVYRSGVELLELGVIPCDDMLTETASVKMMWVLANTKDLTKAKEMMTESLVGEIDMRTEHPEFLVGGR